VSFVFAEYIIWNDMFMDFSLGQALDRILGEGKGLG